MTYTVAALVGVGLSVLLDLVVLRTRVLGRRVFWVAYAIVAGFQLLANGVLTGADIVRYDPAAILGPRVVYAPVEDLLFGFALVTQTLAWWVFWGRRGVQREPVAGPPLGRDRGADRTGEAERSGQR
jgi:lycopene cyclase domain-containing protein